MALEEQYGIGKGAAQVFSFQPLIQTLADQAEINRERNAKKEAERANKAAALNALDDKLKVEGHHSHQKFLQDNLDSLRDYATEQYAEHGEMVFADNPKAKQGWEDKINEFKGYNDASRNIKSSLQSQIDRSMSNEFEMDREGVKDLNEYMDLPLDQQMQRGLPLINERELTVDELFDKGGYGDLMDNTARQFGYETAPAGKGEYKTISGVSIDPKRYGQAREVILTNRKSPYYRAVAREQQEELRGSGLIPETIADETGQEVPNPAYLDVLNERIKKRTEDLMDAYAPKEKITTSRKYAPARVTEEEVQVVPLGEEEGAFRIKELPESISKGGKYEKHVSDVFRGEETGEIYMKTKTPMYRTKGGGLTITKFKGAGAPIPAGAIINRRGEESEENLKAVREIKERKTGDWFAVTTKKTIDLSGVPYHIDSEGNKVKLSGEEGFDNSSVSELAEGAVYKESGKKIIFEDDPKYSQTKGEEKKGDFVKIKPSKGKAFVTIPYTKEVKVKIPELETKRQETKKDVTEEKYNSLQPGDTYYYQGKKYTKE